MDTFSRASISITQDFLQGVFDALSAHIAVIDAKGEIVAVNAAWQRFADENEYPDPGYGIGTNYLRVCEGATDLEVDIIAGIRSVLNRQQDKFYFEYPCHSPDEQRWFLMSATHLVADEQAYVVVAHENITARKMAEESLARHADMLAESKAALEQFAYVASHDLRAPLRHIRSLASWVVEDAADALPEDSQGDLDQIQAQIVRMEKLLDDLLQYSRAGRLSYDPEVIDAKQMIDDLLLTCDMPSGFTVEVKVSTRAFKTARVPLELVLRNLITNAVEHHHRSEGRIEITQRKVEKGVEFVVRDDGPGIPEADHVDIYDMFKTLDGGHREVEGSGMGLALVKKTIEAYSGCIYLESTPGAGAAFRFIWPEMTSGSLG